MLAFMPTRQRTMYPTVDAITRLAFARWRLAGLLVNRASWHKRRVIGNAAAHEHLLITLRGYALGLCFVECPHVPTVSSTLLRISVNHRLRVALTAA